MVVLWHNLLPINILIPRKQKKTGFFAGSNTIIAAASLLGDSEK